MAFKEIIITMLVVVGLGVGLFSFANDMLDEYDVEMDGNFSNTQDKLETALSGTSTVALDIQNAVEEQGSLDVVSGVLILKDLVLEAIKLPFKLIGFATTLLTDISINLGLPSWALTVAIGFIVTVIVIAVFSAILRKDI